LPHIFERFYQADSARSGGGAGLGLSIARWIVEDHDGRISAHNNDHGGATLAIELPLAPDANEAPDEAAHPRSDTAETAPAAPASSPVTAASSE
jgi:K+-sensing histidine kinase KdpD